MLPAWLFLVALIGMAPAVLTLDGSLTLGVEFALLAVALVIAAKCLRPNEVAQLRALMPGIAIWTAVPPILMAFRSLHPQIDVSLDVGNRATVFAATNGLIHAEMEALFADMFAGRGLSEIPTPAEFAARRKAEGR